MKILNFGSLNIDHVYTVPHFVQDGETLGSTGYERHTGGKGLNQSVALAKAGAEVFHAGCIGKDGSFLLDALREAGADIGCVDMIDTPTGHAIVQVDTGGRNCILLYGGANKCISSGMVDRVLSGFGEGDILLLQNEISGLPYIMEKAHAAGMRIALNPSPISDELANIPLQYVDWFILNEVEGAALTGETEPEAVIVRLRQLYPSSVIVLTLGSRGAVYADGQRQFHQPIFPAKVVDTTAAGDTFTGYFLACMAEGIPAETAMATATKASALAITRMGAANSIPRRNEVDLL